MPAPALLPVETRRLIRSGPLDVPFLLPLFGVFAEGHNEADVGEVLSAVSGATGLNFRVLWDHFDGVGFGGNSGFAIRIDGSLYAFRQIRGSDLLDFLYGKGPCPWTIELEIGSELPCLIECGHNAAATFL